MVWQTKREQIGGNRNMLGCTYILLPGLEVTFSKSNMAKKKKKKYRQLTVHVSQA